MVSVGLVIRDHTGYVLATSAQVFAKRFPPDIAEATGILRGVKFAILRGIKFAMESRLIIDDIRDCLRHAGGATISFVLRKANVVAHKLAKLALLSSEDQFWMESYPCLESFVLADRAL
ncbi:hypothetical protein Dsin_024650 [Dipteronia sinensis]|uniref:RNase H type-1 domain-containing protein n=1 Tax=Dipteronia sinensis TaxID=43782 RepID=A0AAD9ZU60_9ROSI|nr:hypothetical protein Dsin_024650 [Dipteronia sinensis]